MISFNPTQLKDKIFSIIEKFSFIKGEIDDVGFPDLLDVAKYNDYDVEITENSKVCFYLGDGEYPETSLAFLSSVYTNWEDSKLNEKQSYAKSKNEVDFLLNVSDYDTNMFLESLKASANAIVNKTTEGIELWASETTISEAKYKIALFNGVCIYHLLVEKSGNVDKDFPSYFDDDYFVRITCDSEIDFKVADSLAVSFIFELHATHNIKISFSEGRADSSTTYYDPDELKGQSYRIFPLLYGLGIKELLELYSTAKMADDTDYKILGFTKVIEYISPTIAKEELLASVSLELTSPTIFAPTSEFIIGLSEIFKKHQNDISKDSELIRLAVTTVTQISDIWDCLPKYIKPKQTERFDMLDDNTRKSCIEDLITAIYDTRNEIAHAKANYEKKGKECPLRDRMQFSIVLDKIAVRCIRWFALQPEEKRVVLS